VVNIRRGDAAARFLLAPRESPYLRLWRMMMAYDSSQTPPSRLDDATLESLRAALRQYLIDDSSPEPVQAALASMAAEARDKRMMPEHVLIALKDTWAALPEVRALPEASHQVRMLQRVVTMCIKEYFGN